MRKKCSSAVSIDDEKALVTRFDFEPGQETGWYVHDHHYAIAAITDCFMMIQHPDGTQTRSEVYAGSAYSRSS